MIGSLEMDHGAKRDPADAEIEVIDRAERPVDFGEHEKSYGEVMKKPHYVVYPIAEDHRSHYEDKKKFAKWTNRQKIGNAWESR